MPVISVSKQYTVWVNEVIIDFPDYTFTRAELNKIGVGMHLRGAANLHRIARRERWSLTDIYRMGLQSFYNAPIKGIGEVTLIVTAYCIAAAHDSWDVSKWIGAYGTDGAPARSIRGGVRSVKKTRT